MATVACPTRSCNAENPTVSVLPLGSFSLTYRGGGGGGGVVGRGEGGKGL